MTPYHRSSIQAVYKKAVMGKEKPIKEDLEGSSGG